MHLYSNERSGSFEECLTRDWGLQARASLRNCIVSWSMNIFLCLLLVQPKKKHPDMTEKMLTVTQRIKSNKNKKHLSRDIRI